MAILMDDNEFIDWAAKHRLSEVQKDIRIKKALTKKLEEHDTEDEEAYVSCNLFNWGILAGDETLKEIKSYDDEYAGDITRRIVEAVRTALIS